MFAPRTPGKQHNRPLLTTSSHGNRILMHPGSTPRPTTTHVRVPLSVSKINTSSHARSPLLQYPKTPAAEEKSRSLLVKTPKGLPACSAATQLSLAFTKTPGASAKLHNKENPLMDLMTPSNPERRYGKSGITRGGAMLAGLAGLVFGLDSPGQSAALMTPQKSYDFHYTGATTTTTPARNANRSQQQELSTSVAVRKLRRLAKTPASSQKLARPYFTAQLDDPSPLKPGLTSSALRRTASTPQLHRRRSTFTPVSPTTTSTPSRTTTTASVHNNNNNDKQDDGGVERVKKTVSFAAAALEDDPFDLPAVEASVAAAAAVPPRIGQENTTTTTTTTTVIDLSHLNAPQYSIRPVPQVSKLTKARYAQQQQFSKEFHNYASTSKNMDDVRAWAFQRAGKEELWGAYYELAKCYRDRGQFEEALAMFRKLNELQPDFINGWIDLVKCIENNNNSNNHVLDKNAKRQEESKQTNSIPFAALILSEAITHNPTNEHLMIRLLKLMERVQDSIGCQEVCLFISHTDPTSTWKSWLQMALFQARSGLVEPAIQTMNYLRQQLPRNGVISNEATKLQASLGNYQEAFRICQEGMEMSARYGLLWFTYLRLFCINKAQEQQQQQQQCSLSEKDGTLITTHSIVEKAQNNLSTDLLWKIHFEAARMESILGEFHQSEHWFKLSGSTCPSTLQWKVLLGNSRMKLRWGAMETLKHNNQRNVLSHSHFRDAQILITESLNCCPQKIKPTVLMECAHLEEFMGNITRAQQLLTEARRKGKSAWRAALEEILLALRRQQPQEALTLARDAVEEFPFTGRLWGMLIQLLELEGPEQQRLCFQRAIQQVPKSGEVWAAGARLALDPTSPFFSLSDARARLEESVKFTPQFGDSFIDSMLLALLTHGDTQARDAFVRDITRACIAADPNYGTRWFRAMCTSKQLCIPGTSAGDILHQARVILEQDLHCFREVYQAALIGSSVNEQRAAQWRDANFFSLRRMYPSTQQLSMADRFAVLFECDALVP